ncbi:MAG: ABC-type Fe3+ transport system, periplasmic component [Halonotius sp. J07HN6]|jgi:ABC-type Fe3+ transport system, periplasmic component|nr:MAG: ABC-type Fe3+ transport system, periplasmic component [Halonotius sp. J07HN6]
MERTNPLSRRRMLQTVAAGSAVGIAGCAGQSDETAAPTDEISFPELGEFRGSGPLVEGRPAPGGTSIEDLPNLEGELNLYIGGGEGGIYFRFVEKLEEIYPNFEVFPTSASSSSLAQTVVEEADAGAPQADLFWSIDASSLAFVANNDAYEPLSADAIDPVPSDFTGPDSAWVGVAGRARSIPYNTNALSEDEIPNKVQQIPNTEGLPGSMGWAPSYGAFKSFITAMRLQQGEETTSEWLSSMSSAGTEKYPNEFVVSSEVADGTLDAGFANHYYALRVKNSRPDAPLDLAFTSGDAGALVNVAGALQIEGTEKSDLVNTFVRHLLSAEAQEFFTTVSFAYPMIPDVAPPGDLPTIDELNPPEIELSALSELEATLDLMRSAGVLG